MISSQFIILSSGTILGSDVTDWNATVFDKQVRKRRNIAIIVMVYFFWGGGTEERTQYIDIAKWNNDGVSRVAFN